MSFQQTTTPSAAPALPSNELKSPTAFRTISEVADDLALPQHVLRFWESKFQQIKPLKRGGGRRYYRPEDVKVIHDIKELLYNQGFTIRGVQKLLRETKGSSVARSMVPQPQLPMSIPALPPQQQTAAPSSITYSPSTQQTMGMSSDKRREVEGVLAELRSIRKILQQSGI
jgi:DNA-binding transcriptional MerR regulator